MCFTVAFHLCLAAIYMWRVLRKRSGVKGSRSFGRPPLLTLCPVRGLSGILDASLVPLPAKSDKIMPLGESPWAHDRTDFSAAPTKEDLFLCSRSSGFQSTELSTSPHLSAFVMA